MRRPGGSGRALRRGRRTSPRGLALAGGGPLGGIYEVGALLALADSLDGVDFSDLDVYVGVSSGGFVAAALANGISPTQMYRLFIDDGADAALTPEVFLRPAFAEFAHRATAGAAAAVACGAAVAARSVPSRLDGVAGHAVARGADRHVRQPVDRRLPASPVRRARPDQRFPKLGRKLFLVATNLDTGASVIFGDARSRSGADLQGDRGLGGPARTVSSGQDRRRVLRRRRAQQDAARVGGARGGHRPAAVRESAGAVRRQQRRARTGASRSPSSVTADCRSCCRRPFARSSIRG